MEPLLRGSVIALTLIIVTNPAAARTPVAPRPVPAAVSLVVVDTPQGFAIVAARSDVCSRQSVPQRRIGSSTSIDAKLVEGSARQ
jgi:hypothetical protein